MANASPLTDAHTREKAANALKRLALFQYVSLRLLVDLVDKYGLTFVPPPPDKRALSLSGGLAVLVVLEGAIRTVTVTPRVFDAGTHVRYNGNLILVTAGTAFRAVGPDTVRVFVLDSNAAMQLPRVIVNALDPVELGLLNVSL